MLAESQSVRVICRWIDRVLDARSSRALSLCTVSPTARSQLVTQSHGAPTMLTAASLHMNVGAGAISVDNGEITATATCRTGLVKFR